jgi:prepilin-type processing-associated H-X9-DG protein
MRFSTVLIRACNTRRFVVYGTQAIHGSICNVLMGDGSVRGVNGSVSGTTW